MIFPSEILCIFLVALEFVNSISLKRDRPRRDLKGRSGAFQVLNHPKRQSTQDHPPNYDPFDPVTKPGQPDGSSHPKEPSTGSEGSSHFVVKPSGPGNGGDNTPLLDFPSYEIDKSPLLDFPDPLEEDFKQRSLTYEGSCRTNNSILLKEKETKKAMKKHKPFIMHEVKTQSRILQQAMMYHFIEKVPIPDHEPLNSWKLLEQTATIFQSFCRDNKHLPASFIPNAIYTFKKLHYLTTPERTEYLSDTNYKWITANLAECSNRSKGFRFYQDQCHQDIVAWKKENNWLCTKWSDDFMLGVYDPLLDIIWHIYNGVYYYCKDYFQQNYWQLHTYAAAMMDLFSNAIKLRWKHQIQAEDFWTRILGPNFLAHARNVERCTQAAVESDELQLMKPRYLSSSSLRYSISDMDAPVTT